MRINRPLGFAPPIRSEQQARDYLEGQGVLAMLQAAQSPSGQIPADLRDLARLHWLVVSRKAFTVLEFGVGWSTLVLAAAMQENQRQWNALATRPDIRNQTPFRIFSVDTSERWIANTRQMLPDALTELVRFYPSPAHAGSFAGRACHFYSALPDVVPDFIYLDGPDPAAVQGDVLATSWQNPDRTVLSGDLLVIEPTLLPGTCVLVDGRSNNVNFLRNNLQREWGWRREPQEDVSLFELQDAPLGRINEATLRYSLGNAFFDRCAGTQD